MDLSHSAVVIGISQDEAQQFMQIRKGFHFTFLARLARSLWLLWGGTHCVGCAGKKVHPKVHDFCRGGVPEPLEPTLDPILTLETLDFVHGSSMQSLSLVMSECFRSGRGQSHVSNFYIVDLENFAIASRLYTGDIHNSTVVGLFIHL